MGSYNVAQRTKDGMFNATALLKQWNNGKRGKEVNGFLKTKPTQDFIEALADSENINTNEIVLSAKGKNGGTWMHPYLFIDFAMWIDPKFKVSVIKFVHDQLIENRHTAGDNYKILSRSGIRLKGYDFVKVARAMQWIVFNKTAKGLRQTANSDQLREITEIQQKLAFAIDMDYINTFKHLIEELRKLYEYKYLKNKISA